MGGNQHWSPARRKPTSITPTPHFIAVYGAKTYWHLQMWHLPVQHKLLEPGVLPQIQSLLKFLLWLPIPDSSPASATRLDCYPGQVLPCSCTTSLLMLSLFFFFPLQYLLPQCFGLQGALQSEQNLPVLWILTTEKFDPGIFSHKRSCCAALRLEIFRLAPVTVQIKMHNWHYLLLSWCDVYKTVQADYLTVWRCVTAVFS